MKLKFAATLVLLCFALPPLVSSQMHKWVDEKGTVHYTDDLSTIPEKFRPDAESREVTKEVPPPETRKPSESPAPAKPEATGYEIDLIRRHELWLVEGILNERVKQTLIVDTGASFTLISRAAADALGIVLDENTPAIPGTTVSGVILTPLVTLRSVRVGGAVVENVEAVIHTMPAHPDGLLGGSFLNRFRVVLDSTQGKMTLHPLQGKPSPDRPGGYGKDYWVGRFRFYHRILEDLRSLRTKREREGRSVDAHKMDRAIRLFENQLDELDRKASLAGVPRSWRE